jgi:quercetin dioxygenase-like cupin family protein
MRLTGGFDERPPADADAESIIGNPSPIHHPTCLADDLRPASNGDGKRRPIMVHHRTSKFASYRRFLLVAAAAIAGGSVGTSAHATAASGFVGTQLLKGQFGDLKVKMQTADFDIKLETKGDSDIYVTRNAIAIGGQSGWHTHPGPSLITVTAGEIVAYDADVCAPRRYATGETFVDAGDGHVHLLRNESGAVAETIAIQFIARNAPRRIDAPTPNNCSF